MYQVFIQDEFGQLVKARQKFMTEREACKTGRQKYGDGGMQFFSPRKISVDVMEGKK